MLADGGKTCGCGAGHATFGQCLRDKGIRLAGPDHEYFRKRTRMLGRYAWARSQGIQPQSPSPRHVSDAIERSDRAGEPYLA